MKKNDQGIWCLPQYDVAHDNRKLPAMLRRGYDAYGEGGFYCYKCGAPSPMEHKVDCKQGNVKFAYKII